jgi:type I restriction enzyme S subunit
MKSKTKAPEGWETALLDELLVTKNNKAKQIKSTEYSAVGSFPVVDQSSDFICGYYDDAAKLIDTDLPLTIFGDHTRHTKFVDFPFIAGADGTQLLKPKHGIDDKFFYYLIEGSADKIGNYGYDRHFKHLKEYVCDYPRHKPEQSKIAEILSTVDRAIEQTEALIGKQQRIKTSLMQDLLTRGIDERGNLRSEETHQFKDSPLGRIPVEWEVKKVTEVSTKVTDGDHHTPKRSPSGFYLLSARNVIDGDLDLSDVDYVSTSEYERMIRRCNPEAGDILISCSGTIGRVSEVPKVLKCVLVRSAALIRFYREAVNSRFAEWMMRSFNVQLQIHAAQRQAAQPNLFQGEIENLKVLIPNIAEQ